MRVSIRAAGPVTAAPPTSGLTATQRARRRSSASRIAATARIGPIERYGLLGAKRMASAASSAARTPGAALGLVRTLVLDAVHVVAMTAPDEPLLERESPGGREDVRAQPIVGRRKDPRADARACCDLRGDLGQRRAVAQRARAHEVEPDVAVAEPEPVLPTEARRRLEGVPRLVGSPPAALGVDEPAERVDEAVEIGRDVEAEDLDVVADVADDRELAGLEDVVEASREARAAAAAGQQDDPHAGRREARASVARAQQP